MPDCRTVGELMKFLGEFPEDMPIFNGVHAQAATEVRGPHSGKKVLYLTFSGTPDEAFRPGDRDADPLEEVRLNEAYAISDAQNIITMPLDPNGKGFDDKVYLIVQDIQQLNSVYGKDNAIMANCHIRIGTASNTPEAGKFLSELTGKDFALAKTEADKVELVGALRKSEKAMTKNIERWGCKDEKALADAIEEARAALARCSHDTAGRSYESGSTLIWGTPTEPQRRLARIDVLCRMYDAGRGIWKQIDENRELLEFLLKEAPELMQRAPFIEAWIGDTDIFLECLVELLELEMPQELLPCAPRSWPGRCLHADAVEQSIEGWAERIRRLEQNGGE